MEYITDLLKNIITNIYLFFSKDENEIYYNNNQLLLTNSIYVDENEIDSLISEVKFEIFKEKQAKEIAELEVRFKKLIEIDTKADINNCDDDGRNDDDDNNNCEKILIFA